MLFFKTLIFILLTTTLYGSSYSDVIKEKKIYPMGKKIYEQRCNHLELDKYNSYEALQADIENKNLCGKLAKKHSEAVSLYLWEVQRTSATHKHFEKLTVSKEEKCPVCGMFLYKYPTWIAKIEYADNCYYFDGIKDMLKYSFEHPDDIKQMLVQDYYTQKTLDAKSSFYVIGSDVYGPMGNEFLALDSLEAAKRFLLDHKGEKILTFDEITEDLVYSLDD